MNWISRKIYLYNVTFGLYMLDWWERYLFNILMIVLLWFIFYNGSRSVAEFYRRSLNAMLFSSRGTSRHVFYQPYGLDQPIHHPAYLHLVAYQGARGRGGF